MSVEAVGGGATFRGEAAQDHARPSCPRRRAARGSSPAAPGSARWSTRASSSRPATRSRAPPSSSSRTRPSWSSTAGRPRSPPRTIWCCGASQTLARTRAIGTQADPVMLEVFNNLFMSIAEQMGVALQNTAYSVNIKERLDFSCAVFDGDGTLVANAPHMPVHLGSMDRAVETIIRENKGEIRPGRRLRASTRPITAARICPTSRSARRCSTREQDPVLGRLARPSRRHRRHLARLDVAATPPRSRRKASTSTISSWSIAAASARRSSTTLLTGAKYPARNPLQNVNDLKAQIAANEKGVQELRKMVRAFHAAGGATPTCSTCRTTPPKACAASSTACTTARSATRWTRAPRSR